MDRRQRIIMKELDNFRYAMPVLAPLKFVEEKNGWKIVVDYTNSIDKYQGGKEQLFVDNVFLDRDDCIEYLDSEIYFIDEENGSCNRYLQKIGDTYYYLHIVLAKIRFNRGWGDEDYAFLDFNDKGSPDTFLLREEGFDSENELLDYLRKESHEWGSRIVRKKVKE